MSETSAEALRALALIREAREALCCSECGNVVVWSETGGEFRRSCGRCHDRGIKEDLDALLERIDAFLLEE